MSLIPDGVSPEFTIEKALSYSALMQKLEALNLAAPVPITPKGKSKTDKETALSQAHRSQV